MQKIWALHSRFELREDRKREAAHNVRQLDTLRRDIFKGVPTARLDVPPQPPPPPQLAHLLLPLASQQPPPPPPQQQQQQQQQQTQPQQPPSPYYGLLSPEEMDQLRLQVINGVREELRQLARELAPAATATEASPASLLRQGRLRCRPDLYQTHLFTQL
ncbi:hypothetical protein HPB48_026009 [Haemaphysalis longicornis]|uniref:Uncharacterized protein n=1 Tax=Haemaphysalis longicornis TaxID=44386 RepID=A0A9J6HAC1_HAELO|nr:hypothetical protein HPB48_026009 [Haemaphysalis longicornis]